jgi:hypothetical protein
MLKLSITRIPESVPLLPEMYGSVEVWRDTQGTVCAYGEIRGEDCWMYLPGLASFRFSRYGSENAVAFTNGARDELVFDAYRRRVLPMELHVRGREVVHASAVRSDLGVTAFCGVSEAGKSTIAFGLHRRGYSLWADDAVAFDVSARTVSAIPLPFEMRLRPSAVKLFGCSQGEGPFDSNVELPAEEARLTAVCVLRRNDDKDASPVTVRRLFSADALQAVLPHAWCFTLQDVERKRRMVNHYLDLVARTLILDVCFQPGLHNLPLILDSIEQELKTL